MRFKVIARCPKCGRECQLKVASPNKGWAVTEPTLECSCGNTTIIKIRIEVFTNKNTKKESVENES